MAEVGSSQILATQSDQPYGSFTTCKITPGSTKELEQFSLNLWFLTPLQASSVLFLFL